MASFRTSDYMCGIHRLCPADNHCLFNGGEHEVRNHDGNGEYRPVNSHYLITGHYLINSRDYEVGYHNDHRQYRDRKCPGSDIFSRSDRYQLVPSTHSISRLNVSLNRRRDGAAVI